MLSSRMASLLFRCQKIKQQPAKRRDSFHLQFYSTPFSHKHQGEMVKMRHPESELPTYSHRWILAISKLIAQLLTSPPTLQDPKHIDKT